MGRNVPARGTSPGSVRNGLDLEVFSKILAHPTKSGWAFSSLAILIRTTRRSCRVRARKPEFRRMARTRSRGSSLEKTCCLRGPRRGLVPQAGKPGLLTSPGQKVCPSPGRNPLTPSHWTITRPANAVGMVSQTTGSLYGGLALTGVSLFVCATLASLLPKRARALAVTLLHTTSRRMVNTS
jgi:hypothetical protein